MYAVVHRYSARKAAELPASPDESFVESPEEITTPSKLRPLILPEKAVRPELKRRRSKSVSEGIGERLQYFEDCGRQDARRRRWRNSIGRIPERQLHELAERLQKQEIIEVQRRGRAWTGPPVRVMPSSGGVRLDGRPMSSEGEPSLLGSDASSVISISDDLLPSDTEEEGDGLQEKHKYRMPDIGKTRLHLRTKEPLSPTPRQVPRSPRRQQSTSTPSTPRTMQSTGNAQSPLNQNFASANASNENVSDGDFVNSDLSRANSIYTLGRASLQGQLSQLTSLRLPDAESLAKQISDIPTSSEAAKALSAASEQIRMWISKASDVLNGLSADDDVEWAAAGGREGIEEVDCAINKFQRLVDVYLISMEELQTRDDVSSLPGDELKTSVKQMEGILESWQKIMVDLKGVKEQVEIAMEWEELWNTVLGEIGQEMEGLNRLIFEMEEKRHSGAGGLLSSNDSIDLYELETIVEEKPGQGRPLSNRFSLPPFSPSSPIHTTPRDEATEDSSLLALFARMQPLRASLDFLPMRLSTFHIRGKPIFPSACEDLDSRKEHLEEHWKKLEADAESLRRELGEDRWVLVFRNAGRQALKMEESITRSFNKLKEALDACEHQTNGPSFTKKVESYEAKKVHYGPAIERVLAIIDRGVLDRLTVNGEILRLQSDMKTRWSALQDEMREMDLLIEDLLHSESNRDKQLRDSVSTVMSSERSLASSLGDTPGSSPASSVIGTSRKNSLQGSRTPTPLTNPKSRKRSSSLLGPTSLPRRIPLTQSGEYTSLPFSSPLATRASNSKAAIRIEPPAPDGRPRWIATKRVESRDFLPLSALEPSKWAKGPVVRQTNFLRSTSTSISTFSQTPLSRPPGRTSMRHVSTPNPKSSSSSSSLQTPSTAPSVSVSVSIQTPYKSSLPIPVTSSTPARAMSAMASRTSSSTPRMRSQQHLDAGRRRFSALPILKTETYIPDGNEADTESPLHHRSSRPSSALANSGRRSSMLPMRTRLKSGDFAAAVTSSPLDERPKWRG